MCSGAFGATASQVFLGESTAAATTSPGLVLRCGPLSRWVTRSELYLATGDGRAIVAITTIAHEVDLTVEVSAAPSMKHSSFFTFGQNFVRVSHFGQRSAACSGILTTYMADERKHERHSLYSSLLTEKYCKRTGCGVCQCPISVICCLEILSRATGSDLFEGSICVRSFEMQMYIHEILWL